MDKNSFQIDNSATAADAAVLQLTEEPSPKQSALAGTVRYLAKLKNIRLTPEQVSGAVTWAENCLRDPQAALVDLGDAPIADPATKFIDRILDVIAATEVMRLVAALIEGNSSPDAAAVMTRAGEAVNRFTAGVPFYRWPEPMETFRLHYKDVPWAPVIIKADGGIVSTSYLRNEVLHRDPMQGPAFHRKGRFGECQEYWVDGKRHRPHEQGPAVINSDIEGGDILHREFHENGTLHRPSHVGPAIIQTLGGHPVIEAYLENGKMHRDPSQGPALHYTTKDNEVWEFTVNGGLHRELTDGPAFIDSNFEGRGVRREEYYRDGQLHRPSHEGPAMIEIDVSGRTVREVYFEQGQRHRNPKEGPAWHGFEEGFETWEYITRGELHRDEQEGPAVVSRDPGTGVIVREEYFRNGQWHREHGPALLTRDAATGKMLREEYYQNEQLHRLNGPASSDRDQAGRLVLEFWCKNGIMHRDPNDGPAWTYRHETEGTTRQDYIVDGQIHRDPQHGPAVIVRDVSGVIVERQYWVNGERLDAQPMGTEAEPC